eukprot:839784_1
MAIHNYVTKNSDVFFEKDKKKKKQSQSKKNVDDKEEYKGNEIKQTESDFEIYDKYILVDAGGGTVDVACHQVTGRFQVKEIHHPSGGKWGSCFIDDQYIEVLAQIFDREWIERFKKERPNKYTTLVYNFQKAKESFYSDPNSKTHAVELPLEFSSYVEEEINAMIYEERNNYKSYKYIEKG